MNLHDPRIRSGIFVKTPYSIGRLGRVWQQDGEPVASIQWNDDEAYSVWPLEKVEFFAENEQEAASKVLGDDYL